VSFDPDALRALGGRPRRVRRPVTAAYLVRVGLAAGLAAAGCNLCVWIVGRNAQWDLTPPTSSPVRPLAIAALCLLVGLLAALASYVCARVTKHPAVWVALVGSVLTAASLTGLPPALAAMHLVTGAWIVGWLTLAARGGSHVVLR
jgi:hypothetical protein